jgi:hypothetical protein
MPTKRTPAKAAPKVTSAGGGVAGKLGERYEAWWTIFEGALRVLDGHFGALCVEEPGSDAIEFRLVSRADGGPDEAHQCKNSNGTSWTVARLRSEGFLVELARQTDLGALVVFVSSSPSVLARMAKKARRLTFPSWQADLSDKEEAASKELQRDWSTTADVVHRRLRLAEFRTIDDETLRDVLIGQIDKTMEGDPEEALGLIRSHIEKHLGEHQITAHELWGVLRAKGHHPRSGTNTAVSEALRDVVHTYVEQVDGSRPPALPLVPRAEVDRITEQLTAEDGPTVVAVVGRPGTGKSSVLAQVCRRLADDVVIGVLRLDLASPATTAAQLGKQEAIGFGDAPSIAMARAGAGKGAVLIMTRSTPCRVCPGGTRPYCSLYARWCRRPEQRRISGCLSRAEPKTSGTTAHFAARWACLRSTRRASRTSLGRDRSSPIQRSNRSSSAISPTSKSRRSFVDLVSTTLTPRGRCADSSATRSTSHSSPSCTPKPMNPSASR